MATSTIKLYYGTATKEWVLLPNKFFVVDDISTYLATFTPTELTNFQYIKPTLEVAINCDLSQTYSEPLKAYGIKYVSIKNSDANKTYYYFVKSAEWRGKQSVKLFLVMDVANTFKPSTDFDFTEKTKITREHKDRIALLPFTPTKIDDIDIYPEAIYVTDHTMLACYYVDTNIYLSRGQAVAFDHYGYVATITSISDLTASRILDPSEYRSARFDIDYHPETRRVNIHSFEVNILNNPVDHQYYVEFEFKINIPQHFQRKIDLQSEGLSPVLYKTEETLINRSGLLNQDWYLLYRNQNDPSEALVNPVQCYLIPENDTDVDLGATNPNGRITPVNLIYGRYYYIPIYTSPIRTITLNDGTQITGSSSRPVIVVQKASDTSLAIMVFGVQNVGGLNKINLENTYYCEYFTTTLPCSYRVRNDYYEYQLADVLDVDFPNAVWTSTSYEPFVIDGIDKFDRTDAKNIKLIKLPYIPYDFDVVSDKLILQDTDFEHVSLTQSGGGIVEVLQLKNLNIKFNYDFNIGLSPFDIFNIDYSASYLLVDKLRDDTLESKIFHSDYYQPKFVYDSFGYVFQLERMDTDYLSTIDDLEDMKIKYVVSTTINSRFMFQFIEYQSVVAKEDYNNVMPVARNNEIVLYNVPYINYIRTGFNYDVKNKQAQATSTWTSVGLGALGTLTALAFPSVPLKIAGVVASLISTAVSVKNAVVSQAQAERNIDEKMLNAKNQGTSVSGSDDVDLMSVYTSNRAKMCMYECSDVIKELLCDLFFYTGYVANRMGLPHLHTRRNFDYIEADIVINDKVNMSDEIMQELVGLYKNGLTFIHKVAERTGDMWDFAQKYENIELSVLE